MPLKGFLEASHTHLMFGMPCQRSVFFPIHPSYLSNDRIPPRLQLFYPDSGDSLPIFNTVRCYFQATLVTPAYSVCSIATYIFPRTISPFNNFESLILIILIEVKKSCANANAPTPPRRLMNSLIRSPPSKGTAFPLAFEVLRSAIRSYISAFWAG